MRIALFTDTYRDDVNGVAKTLGKLVDHAAARGHEVAPAGELSLLAPDPGRRARRLRGSRLEERTERSRDPMSPFMMSMSHADERLLLALLHRRRPLLDALMRLLTRVGNAEVIIPITLALALGGGAALAGAAKTALWSLIGSHLVVQLVKRSVRRERPRLPVGLAFLIVPEDRFSLPSGHATAGLAVALPLALALGGAWAGLVLALGLTVGLSRCYLGVHYPSDVLAGWTLAVASVGLAALLP